MIKLRYNSSRDLTLREFFSVAWSEGRSSIKNPSWGLLDRPYRETYTSRESGRPVAGFLYGRFILRAPGHLSFVFPFYFFRQLSLQCLGMTMLEDSIIRSKVFLINFVKHPSLYLGSQNSMMRKTNISKIINATSICFEDYFLWMHIKAQSLLQKDFDFFKTVDKQFFVWMNKNKIIGVSNIAGDFQFMFDELIKLVQVNIGKQLGSQVAQRQAGRETLNYISEKCHKPLVGCSFLKNIQEDIVINGVEKLSDIEFQNPECPSVVSRQFESETLQSFDCSMNAFVFSRRPRVKNKDFIPFRLNDPVDGMMEQPVANRRLMDMATFRIAEKKRDIAAMLVVSVFQILMQFKNVIFEIYLEFGHIFFVGFLFFEFRPSVEQVLQRNDFIEHKYG